MRYYLVEVPSADGEPPTALDCSTLEDLARTHLHSGASVTEVQYDSWSNSYVLKV